MHGIHKKPEPQLLWHRFPINEGMTLQEGSKLGGRESLNFTQREVGASLAFIPLPWGVCGARCVLPHSQVGRPSSLDLARLKGAPIERASCPGCCCPSSECDKGAATRRDETALEEVVARTRRFLADRDESGLRELFVQVAQEEGA